MRPRDSTFLGQERLPVWAATLTRELAGGGDEAPPAILTPLAALDEIVATASSLIEGRGDVPSGDRASLGQDVSASLSALGTATTQAVVAVLRSFQARDLRPLPQLLADIEGARRLVSAARLLADELCLAQVSRAAWKDCVEAFRDGANTGTCELRIAQVRELCVRRGHGWAALEHRLRSVLADRPYAVLAAGAEEDEIASMDDRQAAGLTIERRMELCADLVGAVPQERDTIVWLAYANADLRRAFLRCGPMQLFSHQLPLDAIRDGCPALNTPDFERPAELADPFAEAHLSHLPDEPHVLVRIRVPPGRIADVAAHARNIASGLVDAANPASQWVLAEGAAMFSDGGWWGTLGFADPAHSEATRRHVNSFDEGTGEALAALDERLVSRLAEGGEAAATAIAERRWEKAVTATADPAQRIALAMRTLERALPVARSADETLRDACERYLLDAWTFRALRDELFDAAYHGIWSLPRSDDAGSSLQWNLREAVLPSTGELSFQFKVRPFIERVGDLVDALPECTMERRMAAEAAESVDSPGEALRRLGELDGHFRRLLARAIRQRNAVVHGAATVPTVVMSCEPFLCRLGRYVVEQTILAVSEEEELLDRLEHARAAWLRQREALRRGAAPAEVLFAGSLREDAGAPRGAH
jgi:hypothetical protein